MVRARAASLGVRLTADQRLIFLRTITLYNLVVYPVLGAVGVWLLLSLREPYRQQTQGGIVDAERRVRAQRRVINLPWFLAGLAAVGWGLCAPVFLYALSRSPEPLDPMLYAQLPISFAISGMIAITHGVFVVELVSQRTLYPVFFRDARPSRTPGPWRCPFARGAFSSPCRPECVRCSRCSSWSSCPGPSTTSPSPCASAALVSGSA